MDGLMIWCNNNNKKKKKKEKKKKKNIYGCVWKLGMHNFQEKNDEKADDGMGDPIVSWQYPQRLDVKV